MGEIMKSKKIIFLLLIVVVLLTGCTKTLKDGKEVIKNPETGQNLTQNILCRPTDKDLIKIYSKYEDKVDLGSLPDCEDFKINTGHDEGLWTNIFVKPLAWIIISFGKILKNYGLALIVTTLVIRFAAFPLTKKTAMQSELIKQAQPELDRLEKKYEGKNDQESMIKKTQEMQLIYRKYNINPLAGCLFAFIQLPVFIAFFEAINRVPAIFEDTFLGLYLGTTPATAIGHGQFQYLIIVVILAFVTYYSFKMNSTTSQNNQTAMMTKSMTIMIIVMSIFMTTALDIYWLTSSLFTIGQNLLIKRSKKE